MFVQLAYLVISLAVIHCLPEPTKWLDVATLSGDSDRFIQWYHATLFNDTRVKVAVDCYPNTEYQEIKYRWMLRNTDCSGNYIFFDESEARSLIDEPMMLFMNEQSASFAPYNKQTKSREEYQTAVCSGRVDLSVDAKDLAPRFFDRNVYSKGISLTKRNADNSNDDVFESLSGILDYTWRDGPYILILDIQLAKMKGAAFDASADLTVRVEFQGTNGYLSAIDAPLFSFYGIMCFVYSLYASIWIVFCSIYWRDLLRVQYWIGAVIALGLIEKAVFLVEYQHMNEHGQVLMSVEMLAETVSALKRTLSRVLIIIVSLGFGIVKPRLGDVMKKVVLTGCVYFIFALIEAATRVYQIRDSRSAAIMLAALPLAIADACICYWIMTSLMATLKNLKLRRNVVKLALYRHFFNVIVFCVLAAIAYIIWSIMTHKLPDCFTDWQEIWIDDAYWHFLFSVMLATIIILWRPSQNNQRYAFSPLFDKEEDNASDDEEESHQAYDNMNTDTENLKIRSISKSHKSKPIPTEDPTEDENLKWVEDHIPTAGFDSAINVTMNDSEEEAEHTKTEMSKMR